MVGLLPNQSELRLPIATKRQTLAAEAGKKKKGGGEKGFLFQIKMIWDNGELPTSKFISPTKLKQNPAAPSETKTKSSARNSCSILKYSPLEHKAASKW